MAGITRGFTGRRQRDPRLPPGQYDVGADWPVLTAEVTPRIDPERWSIRVDGLVDEPTTWTWDQAHALPPSRYEGDIHCVTTWSKLATNFDGVSVDTLLATARPQPTAAFVLATSSTRYTTNLPLADITTDEAIVAYAFEGEPIEPIHGGPVRIVVPHLYFWKSAKWVRRLELRSGDEPGFWERNGYHNYGDPFTEQRYWGD